MPNIENSPLVDGETTDNLPDQVVLRATNLEKSYDSLLPFSRRVEVLSGADFELRAGEIVGIVGANGSGKSTLMKILVGALEADGGRVERSAQIGWCPQEPLLYDRLTVSETFELFGRAYGMDAEAIDDAREHLAERLEFEEFLDYRVDHLSGGNRQKVNLGVALLQDPDVVLLDEPYTGFDWETYLAFWGLTEELTAEGTAIAIISHFVSEHERFDRLYELEEGRLSVRDGPESGPTDGARATGVADTSQVSGNGFDSDVSKAVDESNEPEVPDGSEVDLE